MINRMHSWLQGLHPGAIVVLSLLLVALLGRIDWMIDYELSFSIFYLLPVLLTAWYGPPRSAQLLALISSLVWLIAAAGHPYSQPWIPYWNAAVRLGFFLITGHLLVTVRFYLTRESDLARIDPLTGVLNGRAFLSEGQRFFALAARSRRPISVAYIDLDDFKRINDTSGHAAGDRVLQEVARSLSGSLRQSDVVARLGGDEFALILPDAGARSAHHAVERIRRALSSLSVADTGPVSLSVGVVTFAAIPALEKAMQLADELMYSVKRSGKGGVAHRVWNADETVTEPEGAPEIGTA